MITSTCQTRAVSEDGVRRLWHHGHPHVHSTVHIAAHDPATQHSCGPLRSCHAAVTSSTRFQGSSCSSTGCRYAGSRLLGSGSPIDLVFLISCGTQPQNHMGSSDNDNASTMGKDRGPETVHSHLRGPCGNTSPNDSGHFLHQTGNQYKFNRSAA